MTWLLKSEEDKARLHDVLKKAGVASGQAAKDNDFGSKHAYERLMKMREPQATKTIEKLFLGILRDRAAKEGRTLPAPESDDELGDELRAMALEEIRKYCVPKEEAAAAVVPADDASSAPLALTIVYVKFISLKKRSAGADYVKFLPRTGKEHEVFDECLIAKTLIYKQPESNVILNAFSSGFVDIMGVFPPDLCVEDTGIPGLDVEQGVSYREKRTSSVYNTISTVCNGFQSPEKHFLTTKMLADCDRVVYVVDFASLRIRPETLLPDDCIVTACLEHTERDKVTNKKTTTRRLMACQREGGLFLIDSAVPGKADGETEAWDPNIHLLRENDIVRIQFPIAWSAVPGGNEGGDAGRDL